MEWLPEVMRQRYVLFTERNKKGNVLEKETQ